MEIREFAEIIKAELEEKGLEVNIQEVTKNNGVKLLGLAICNTESNLRPTIYMEPYLEAYENGIALDEIVNRICKFDKQERISKNMDMEWFRDFEKVKGKVAYKLVNYAANKELLKSIPHKRVLDLVKVYYVVVDTKELGTGTILIHNNHAEVWGVTVEQLDKVAVENTPKLLPVRIVNMMEIMAAFMDIEDLGDAELPMYVMSNSTRVNGAATICYAGILKEFADNMDVDYLYLLPSSIHEWIMVTPKENMEVCTMQEMVAEINRTQVERVEVLSDSVYIYNRERDTVAIA